MLGKIEREAKGPTLLVKKAIKFSLVVLLFIITLIVTPFTLVSINNLNHYGWEWKRVHSVDLGDQKVLIIFIKPKVPTLDSFDPPMRGRFILRTKSHIISYSDYIFEEESDMDIENLQVLRSDLAFSVQGFDTSSPNERISLPKDKTPGKQ